MAHQFDYYWHTIRMPDGSIIKGQQDYTGAGGDRFLLPADLTGKTVIDFGTWTGFWATEAKRRGASRVVASDRWDPIYTTTKYVLDAWQIEYKYSGNLDFPLDSSFSEEFDVVLLYGIIYHLKNPYMGFYNAARCCKKGGIVIVESAILEAEGQLKDRPKVPLDVPLTWVIDKVHHGDASNYHIPNMAAIRQWGRMAGLEPTGQECITVRGTAVFRKL